MAIPTVKRIGNEHARSLTYAIQHFLSITKAKGDEGSLAFRALAESVKGVQGNVEYQIKSAGELMEPAITLCCLSELESDILDSAIVSWGWELRDVDSDTAIKRECTALIMEWDSNNWRPVK